MVDVVVSVWGDPSGWKPVRGYVVELPSGGDGGGFFVASRSYRSSLGALMEAFGGARVLLFASSTLGDPGVGSYRGLVGGVGGFVRSFVAGGEYCCDASRVGVVVLPGVGRFGRGVVKSFLGWLGQFRVAAFLKALEFIVECRPERVILDLTHGVNYMPAYVRLSVFDALTCYAALNRDRRVRLLVYNSEPFPAGADYAEGLNIMLVEDHLFDSRWALSRLYDLLASSFTGWVKPTPIRSVFGLRLPAYSEEGWRRLYGCVKRFVDAVSWGLIIPLAESVEELSSIGVEDLKCELERFSYLRDCEDLVEIDGSTLRYLFSPMYEAALLLGLAEVVKSLALKPGRVDGGFSGTDLKRLGDALLPRAPLELFKHEWSQLEDRVGLARLLSVDVAGWRRYKAYTELGNVRFRNKPLLQLKREVEDRGEGLDRASLICELGDEVRSALREGEGAEKPEVRNFIAHAGLERNVTLVSATSDSIYVKYDENLRKSVDDIIKKLRG